MYAIPGNGERMGYLVIYTLVLAAILAVIPTLAILVGGGRPTLSGMTFLTGCVIATASLSFATLIVFVLMVSGIR
jgi:hypothetical protein